MPTYQYRCTDCGRDLEAVQKFSDPALTTCPSCAGSLRKVFNAVGVVFKGSGFYRTDSRGSSGRVDGNGDGGSGGDTKGEKVTAGAGDKGAADKSAKPADSSGANGTGKAKAARSGDSGTPSTGSKAATT